jgi:hypothetical protein
VRLWTLHPGYLDARGLVALWREALLAAAVLAGRTRGYRHHPQLERFRAAAEPGAALGAYLAEVHREARRRGYSCAADKLPPRRVHPPLVATEGQLLCEWAYLAEKLRRRSPAAHRALAAITVPAPHPLFRVVPGPRAAWERAPAA